MSNSPRVSIIINNYNYGRFLGEAIDSALAQTNRNTEVIVVDDGSTDESRAVIRRYADRITVVLKQNGGQGSAYNAGFAASRGEIVTFLDSDDILFHDAADTVAELMGGAETVKVQWPLRVVDAEGNWHGELSTRQRPPDGDLRRRVVADGPLYDFEFTTGSAYRRSFLQRVFQMPERPYRNGADVYLITLAPVFGIVCTAPDAHGTYRAHGRNNYRDRRLDTLRLQDYISRFEMNCSVLRDALALQGTAVDAEQWKQRNFNYLWPTRLLRATQDIEKLIPEGASYVLVDCDEWGGGDSIPGRHAIPFLEKDGGYWGPPPDDKTAIQELERLRMSGADFCVIWWTAFWSLEHFSAWASYLNRGYPCLLHDDHLQIFDLRCGLGTSGS